MSDFKVNNLKINNLTINDKVIDLSILSDLNKDQYGRLTFQGRVLGNVQPSTSEVGVLVDTDILIQGASLDNTVVLINQLAAKKNWVKQQYQVRLINSNDTPSLMVNNSIIDLYPGLPYSEYSYITNDVVLNRYDINDSLKISDSSNINGLVTMDGVYKLKNITDNIEYSIVVKEIGNNFFRITPSVIEVGKTYKLMIGVSNEYATLESDIVLSDTRTLELLTSSNVHNLNINLWIKG